MESKTLGVGRNRRKVHAKIPTLWGSISHIYSVIPHTFDPSFMYGYWNFRPFNWYYL